MPSAGLGGSVGYASDWSSGRSGFDPRLVRQNSFVETDYEIFSMGSLPLPLIQKSSCQCLAKECAQILVNRLED